MTNPAPSPDYGPYVGIELSSWCRRCEIHRATTRQPLCPSCLEDTARELRGAK